MSITYHMIEIKLESSLSNRLLNSLAVGRIAGRAGTSLAIVNETADLICRSPGILLAGAETVHQNLQATTLVDYDDCASLSVVRYSRYRTAAWQLIENNNVLLLLWFTRVWIENSSIAKTADGWKTNNGVTTVTKTRQKYCVSP